MFVCLWFLLGLGWVFLNVDKKQLAINRFSRPFQKQNPFCIKIKPAFL